MLLLLSSLFVGTETQSFAETALLDSPEAHFQAAVQHAKFNKHEKAREEFIKAVLLDLESSKYHRALVFHYLHTRRGPQGIKLYQDLVQKHPKSPGVHYWLGRLYLQKQDLSDAVREFEAASHLSPDDAHPLIALGHAYFKEGEDEKALKVYRRATQINPNVASVRAGVGSILYNRQEYAKAQKEFEAALKLDDSLTEARYNLGLIYEKSGKGNQAQSQWQAILEADPNESNAREKLAQHYFQEEKYNQSVQEYLTLTKQRPGSPEALTSLAEAMIMLATTVEDSSEALIIKEAAVEAFQQAFQMDPQNTRAKNYLKKLNAPLPHVPTP